MDVNYRVIWDYIGIMEKKMETTNGLCTEVLKP